MKVLSHRGWWEVPDQKNSLLAFERSLCAGFGVETDIRDRLGELVISHDMPRGGEPTLREFLDLVNGIDLPIALNIKSDGLATELEKALAEYDIPDYFVFDASIPDSRAYLSAGLPICFRLSELEPLDPRAALGHGIWLDAFEGTWFDTKYITQLLSSHGRVCVVSPELHGREYLSCWRLLKPLVGEAGLYLCTDFPEEAQNFLGMG